FGLRTELHKQAVETFWKVGHDPTALGTGPVLEIPAPLAQGPVALAALAQVRRLARRKKAFEALTGANSRPHPPAPPCLVRREQQDLMLLTNHAAQVFRAPTGGLSTQFLPATRALKVTAGQPYTTNVTANRRSPKSDQYQT